MILNSVIQERSQVSSNSGVLFLELFAVVPLGEGLMNLFLTKFESIFGILTPIFLQAPALCTVSEVKTLPVVLGWAACPTSGQAEVVAVVDPSSFSHFLLDGGDAYIVAFNVSSFFPVLHGIIAGYLRVRLVVPADDFVDVDVSWVINYFEALVDSRVDVRVPHSSSIN